MLRGPPRIQYAGLRANCRRGGGPAGIVPSRYAPMETEGAHFHPSKGSEQLRNFRIVDLTVTPRQLHDARPAGTGGGWRM